MSNFQEFAIMCAYVLGVTAALLAVGIFCANILASNSCHASWRDAYETDYGFFSGCRIKVDGKWLPEGRYRNVEIGR